MKVGIDFVPNVDQEFKRNAYWNQILFKIESFQRL